jgi:uncharacterized membrane protein
MDLEAIGVNSALLVKTLGGILISVCQLLALLVIFIGISRALIIYLKSPFEKTPLSTAFQRSRLMMGYSFSLGLSFLIGATILKTMVSSQWEDIARLAVIIAVRTILNHLLLRAIQSSGEVTAQANSPTLAGLHSAELNSAEPNDRKTPQPERVGIST